MSDVLDASRRFMASGDHPIEIPLTKGFVAIVDEADFELVGHVKWHAALMRGGQPYARRTETSGRQRWMHRVIIGAAPGQFVDHINRDGLDNRRANLRFATYQQNAFNRGPLKGRYCGVSLFKTGKWRADIYLNGRQIYLGLFETEDAAAIAYDAAARRLHGEFAYLNFPEREV